MRSPFLFAFSAVCGLVLGLPARAADLVLMHARVYTAPGLAAMDDATIVIHNGRIESAGPQDSRRGAKFRRGATVIDCTGMTVTAGLWNSHVHILPLKFLHADQKLGPELTVAFQEMLTKWGFTTVFDIASILANTNQIRTRIATREILGPRILTTGEPFFPPHGVPVYVQGYLAANKISLPDDVTTAEAVARVQRQVLAQANGIKIFAGSIEEDGVLMMPLERAQAIVKEAHVLNRPVFAHPSNLAGVEVALNSGVDILAHLTSDKEPWTPALVGRMLAAHMALVPTLTLFDYEAKKGGSTAEAADKFVATAVERLRLYAAGGGEILFGTDVGYIYQFDTTEEYRLMKQAGMSFAQILASLTTNPARRFGLAEHSGKVAAGMDADLAVFQGDPGAEIENFAKVGYTIREGKIIYKAAGMVGAPVP